MLSSKIKDIKIRKSFEKIEKIKKIKKFVFTNLLNNPFPESINSDNTKLNFKNSIFNKTSILKFKNYLSLFFLKNKKNKMLLKSKIRMTNRCVFNNRNRGVLRLYGISRSLLRELIQFGLIPGFSKAVW